MMTLVEEKSALEHRGRNVGIVVSAAAIIGLAAARQLPHRAHRAEPLG